MNDDIIKGNWKQMRGKIKERWGEITDDELDVINGHRDQLIGKIQERYGRSRDEVARELKDFQSSL